MPGVGGYAKLVQLMGRHDEYGNPRRFSLLGFENLLDFQAELTRLEVDLKRIIEKDQAS